MHSEGHFLFYGRIYLYKCLKTGNSLCVLELQISVLFSKTGVSGFSPFVNTNALNRKDPGSQFRLLSCLHLKNTVKLLSNSKGLSTISVGLDKMPARSAPIHWQRPCFSPHFVWTLKSNPCPYLQMALESVPGLWKSFILLNIWSLGSKSGFYLVLREVSQTLHIFWELVQYQLPSTEQSPDMAQWSQIHRITGLVRLEGIAVGHLV